MAPTRYKSGERFAWTFTIRKKADNALTDPATATLKLKNPVTGVVTSYSWPVPSALERTGTGTFKFEGELVDQGEWERRLESDIGCVLEDSIIIDQSPFQ
jgi:hypothetical protein